MKTVHFVRVRKGEHWKQVVAIADNCVFIYELVPAVLGGWNFHKLTKQEGESWSGMSADQILAWINQERPPDTCLVPATEYDIDWLREQLAKVDVRLGLRKYVQCNFNVNERCETTWRRGPWFDTREEADAYIARQPNEQRAWFRVVEADAATKQARLDEIALLRWDDLQNGRKGS